jgi:ketosteroid isomerase-like protein
VLLAVTAAAGNLSAQTPADTASVLAFYAAWFGPAQQEPVTYASFYAPDGVILPPNAPPLQGREAIAEWQRRARAEATYSVLPEGMRTDEIRFLGPNWVVYRGTLWGQRVPKAGGEPVPFETKYFDVLTRADGTEWKVAYRMWSDSR